MSGQVIVYGKWSPGRDSALFVESTGGLWKAMVHDDATWSVRGPDPDNAAHYASGEATNADVGAGKSLDAKARVAAAKKMARAYIAAQIEGSGTRKTKAMLDAEIAAELAKYAAQSRPVQIGDRYDCIGQTYEVVKIGRDRARTIQMARPTVDGFGKRVMIDQRSFPLRDLDRHHMRKIG
jgi:hypothetical protein